ncbi:MAG: LacI family DNA-binding transcriptional regulator [Kiloniellales bacterium]|nr:LacI family DNA-binding transcriptional regulator [Kiloniellales bacterium]
MTAAKIKARPSRRPAHNGIREVARAAGVSIATVSRAFNRPEAVNAETRERVLAAAQRLTYIPDGAARSLSSQKSFRVGVVIPTMDDSIFARFVEALQQRLGTIGYALLIGVDRFNAEQELIEVRNLLESGVDAVVLCGAQRSQETYELLETRALPYLITHVHAEDPTQISVGYDNREGAAMATHYLADLGHERIGVMDYPPERNDRAGLRIAGVVEALAERGLTLPPERRIERPFSIEEGRIGLRQLLAQDPRPTAVFCGNDILAVGALFEAQAQGLRVPEELSIVGYDNLELTAQVAPALTTVHVPTGEMGARAAEVLSLILSHKSVPRRTRIGTSLIIRKTTGPAPTAPTTA